MSRLVLLIVAVLSFASSAFAQLDGAASTGVSASLIRLFGTNNAFTAQVEMQLLGKDNKEYLSMPMTFALLTNKIRIEIEMSRMRNKLQPDALARVKPLGLDSVVSIIRPEKKLTLVTFPKLQSFVKLEMPSQEAEAFLTRAKIERKDLGNEKMEGQACVKQRVVITDDAGHKSEATVWTARALRDFPVVVATKESDGTVVMRFRQIQFTAPEASRFEPPAGFSESSDMQALMAGPGSKFMRENRTSVTTSKPAKNPVPNKSSKPASANSAK
jgi:hypothetical protein